MRWIRTSYVSRLLAGVLIASMLPALLVPSSRAASVAIHGSYSQWIRAQLRVPADEALEAALTTASESGPASFQSFVEAFLDAYEEANPEKPAALAFTHLDLSNDALVSFLQRRYAQIGDEGLLPRVYFTTAAGLAASGFYGSDAAHLGTKNAPETSKCGRHRSNERRDVVVVPLRTLTAARPLGP